MKKASRIFQQSGPIILGLTLFGLAWNILSRRFFQNGLHTIWLDESIMVFIANHKPFTAPFFAALKENIAGMPWPFIEYGIFLNILKGVFPLPFIMDHLEYWLRLPLTLFSAVTILSMFVMGRRLSRSWMISAWTTACLFLFNYLSQHLGGELRFHSSAFMHIALSWCLLSCFLTSVGPRSHIQSTFFFLWLIELFLTGWSHLYGIYSVFLQAIVFALAAANLFPLSIPWERPSWLKKTLTTIFITFIGIAQLTFFITSTPHPYSRTHGSPDLSILFNAAWRVCNQLIFFPGLTFWLISLIIIGGFALIKSANRKIIPGNTVLFILATGQIAIMLLAGMYYTHLNWGPENWGSRYIMMGLIPFTFFYCALARDIIPPAWDKRGSFVIAGILLGIFITTPRVRNTYGGTNTVLSGKKYEVALRNDLRRLNAYRRVTTVLGLRPIARHLDQKDVFGTSMDFTWQIYVKGPFNMTPITQYKTNLYGGLRGFPCVVRDIYPLADGPAEEFVIDFCDKDNYQLRIFKPLPETSNP